MSISVFKATREDLQALVPLLDAYRVFYKQVSDLSGAEDFLRARFRNRDSEIFLAKADEITVGFVQLYPSFSTVSMKPIYILNDLYVDPSYRNLGVGEVLLKKAKEFCVEKRGKGLALETALNNPAQALYERLGWKKDVHCFHYFWSSP